jgi:hypothetical protein
MQELKHEELETPKTNVLIHGVKVSTLQKLTDLAKKEELSRNRFINGILDEFTRDEK